MITKTIHASITRKRIPYSIENASRKSYAAGRISLHSNRISYQSIKTTIEEESRFCTTQRLLHPKRHFHSSLTPFSKAINCSTLHHDEENKSEVIDGEYCYQKVLEAIEKKQQQELEVEQKQASEQYEAMERVNQRGRAKREQRQQQQQQTTNKRRTRISKITSDSSEPVTNKAAGVAVIRTITRQARQRKQSDQIPFEDHQILSDPIEVTKTTHDSESDDFPSKLQIDWKKEEQIWLEKAAYEFLHPKALVRLGNQMLQQAKTQYLEQGQTRSKDHENNFPPNFFDMNDPMETRNLHMELQDMNMNSVQNAAYLYKLAGKQKSKEGWFNLGHLLWTGFPEVEDIPSLEKGGSDEATESHTQLLKPNIVSSLAAFEKAIELNDADAMYFVGVQMLLLPESAFANDSITTMIDFTSEMNIDTTTDFSTFPPPPSPNLHPQRQRGLYLIQKAAKIHLHGGAMHYLSLLYLNGDASLHIQPCTPTQFQTLLDSAADLGHNSDALYLRAHSYYHGHTFFPSIYPPNKSKALEEFEKAAEWGSSDGAISAGAMWYEQGEYEKAFDWYQKAAEMGNKEGWRNLVRCYALGEGVAKSESTAKHIAKLMLSDDDSNEESNIR